MYHEPECVRETTGLCVLVAFRDVALEVAVVRGLASVRPLMPTRLNAEQITFGTLCSAEFAPGLHVDDCGVESATQFECLRVRTETRRIDCDPVVDVFQSLVQELQDVLRDGVQPLRIGQRLPSKLKLGGCTERIENLLVNRWILWNFQQGARKIEHAICILVRDYGRVVVALRMLSTHEVEELTQ